MKPIWLTRLDEGQLPGTLLGLGEITGRGGLLGGGRVGLGLGLLLRLVVVLVQVELPADVLDEID